MLDGLTSVLTALAKNKGQHDHPGHWQRMGCPVLPYWLKPSAWKKEVWKMKERALEFFLKGAWMNRTKRNPCQSLQAPFHSAVLTTARAGWSSSVAGSHSRPCSLTQPLIVMLCRYCASRGPVISKLPPQRWLIRNETPPKDPKEERTVLMPGALGLSPELAIQLHLVPAGGLSLTLQFMIAQARSMITAWD